VPRSEPPLTRPTLRLPPRRTYSTRSRWRASRIPRASPHPA
jgi:hypothetical protein